MKEAFFWDNIGTVYRKLKNYTKAIECYEKAIEIDTNDAETWCNLAIVYGSINNYTKAVECHQKAIAIDANNATAGRISVLLIKT